VHRALGPGLLESAYETCLVHELTARGMRLERRKELPLQYKGIKLDATFRLDLVVENTVIVELKSVESLLPLHEAQLISYLRLAHLPVGLLINFNVPVLSSGVRRLVNNQLAMRVGAS
jgi:GxxExxY protein